MKFFNLLRPVTLVLSSAMLFTACKRDKEITPIGDGGQTILKLMNGGPTDTPGEATFSIDFVSTPSTIDAADIRRDPANPSELNKTVTVTLVDDTAAVAAAGYIPLDPSWYTVTGSNITKTGGEGGTYTVVMQPGEFAKQIQIVIPDATVLDPSEAYALAFRIVSSDQGKVSVNNTVIAVIGAKNIYDGIYSVVSGTVTRYTAPGVPANDALSGSLAGNPDVFLITTGANTVEIPPSGFQGALYWAFGNNSQVAGINGLQISVDPATNLVTMSSAANPTLTNWAGHPNYYDPATQTFHLAFRWNPTSNVREYEVVLKYKMPR